MTLILAALLALGLAPADRIATTQIKPLPARAGCDGIYDELVRQGANDGVARRFAYFIAPRESGCRAVYVDDSDDWSYSRFGLNGRTAVLRDYWRHHCGADVRADTVNLSTDVKCALAAYRDRGWAPWAYA